MKTICAILAVLILTSTSTAAVIYTNGDPLADNGTHYSKSDTVNPSQICADNFILTTPATINSVRWWGAWNFFTPATDDFTVTFYEDKNGRPDPSNVIANRRIGNVVETSTGLNRSGFLLREFQANIAPVSLSDGTNYWISIFESAGTNGSQYFLLRENAVGSAATSVDGGVSWGSRPREFSFQLEGSSNAVPEPTTAAVLSVGGVAFAMLRRRSSSRKTSGAKASSCFGSE
jgi:hypothetical protein